MAKSLTWRVFVYGLLILGGLVVFQDHLLYFPDNPPRADLLAEARRDGLRAWPDADDYRGLVREPAGPARGTVLLFHGNAGHAGHRAWYAETLSGLGLRVILAEYPAYGSRPGDVGEAALVDDAAHTLALVRQQFPGPLLLAGESLGAGVAAAAIARTPAGVTGILLITPWDRLEHVARHHYPWLPVSWLLRDRYDSSANLATARVPVAVIVAADDRVVPARFGHALYATLRAPRRLWVVEGADHNDWAERMDAPWWQAVVDHLLGSLRPPSGG